MAINTTNSFSGPFLTNGATKVFPFTFTAPSAAEVSVLLRAANGVETAGAGFVVTVNPNGGGSVTFAVAPAAGSQLLILLNPYFTQQIEFENGSAWLAEPVNEQADRSALRDQVLKRDIGRALLVPVGTPGAVMPSLQSIRGKFLSVNADDEFYGADGTGADGAMRSDLASTTAGKGAALVAREDGESVETSLTAIEGSLGGIVALGQFNRLLSKLDSDSADANVVILSDSTGDAVDEWPYLLFGGRVANAYPAWTIKIRYWVGAAYAAAVTLQNGTGVHTLTVLRRRDRRHGRKPIRRRGFRSWRVGPESRCRDPLLRPQRRYSGAGPLYLGDDPAAVLLQRDCRSPRQGSAECPSRDDRAEPVDQQQRHESRWDRRRFHAPAPRSSPPPGAAPPVGLHQRSRRLSSGGRGAGDAAARQHASQSDGVAAVGRHGLGRHARKPGCAGHRRCEKPCPSQGMAQLRRFRHLVEGQYHAHRADDGRALPDRGRVRDGNHHR